MNSTLILSDSLEIVYGCIEVASSYGSFLLFIVKEFDIAVKDIDRVEGLQSLGIPFEDFENLVRHIQVGHALGVVVVFINVIEGEIGADGLANFCDGLHEVFVADDFPNISLVHILLHPVVLFVAIISRIGSQEISLIPRTHFSLFNMHGEGMESLRSCENQA